MGNALAGRSYSQCLTNAVRHSGKLVDHLQPVTQKGLDAPALLIESVTTPGSRHHQMASQGRKSDSVSVLHQWYTVNSSETWLSPAALNSFSERMPRASSIRMLFVL
jgi:hypothetical protein